MAKKRLRIKDSSGNVVQYDVAASDVTLQDGTDVETAMAGLGAGTVKGVKMNGAEMPENDGVVDLGTVVTEHQSLAALFGKIAYDNSTHRINFYGKDDTSMTTVLGYIDCSPFIVDGMLADVDVKNVSISGVSTLCMVFSFNTDAGQQDINIPVSAIFDASQYYTKSQADGVFQVKLVSGTNIKTVNNESILGEGNISIPKGEDGDDGKSAYEIAVDNGFEGTEAEWVASLKGQKGDTGNVVVSDGVAQIGIINDLETGGEGDALSARQGLVLRQAVNTVQANLQAVLSALANMAFSGSKPTLTPIDWTGGTFYATVNYGTMTGVTHTDDSINGQVEEHETLTVLLTALSGYTLTGATISVTNSKGQAVAYSLDGSTLTIADVVGSITISVIAKAVYSVANNDTHVDLSTQTPNPVAGSSWSGTLSLKGSVSGYRLATTPLVKMNNVEVDFTATGNSWNPANGAMTIGEVTGNIVILEAAVEIVAHTITKKLLNVSDTNTTGETTDADFGYKKQSVEDGVRYTTTLAAVTGATSNNDVVVKMGGVDITSSAYDSSTGEVNIAEVTGDVVIVATAATGVIKVTSNAAVTGGITINGTAHDIAVGDTTINGITAITALAFSADAKTAITALDFGGATSGMESFNEKFKNFTSLTDFYGLVITSSCQNLSMTFQGCINLETLSTIGWRPVLRYINTLANNCEKLEALDLSGVSFLNNCDSLYSIASGCTSMTKLVLPATEVPSITDLRAMFSGSHITYVDMSDLVLTGVTNMSTMLSNAQIGTLDIRGINTSTTGPTTLQFWSQNAVIGTLIIGQFDMARVTDIGFITQKISRIVCTTTTPPSINPDKNWVSQQEDVQIYVPASAVGTYKAATGWSAVAGRIHIINEYSE